MMISEWSKQSGILMAWPDAKTDWSDNLSEAESCYRDIIREIVSHQKVYLICRNTTETQQKLAGITLERVVFIATEYNDTWARDFGPLAISENNQGVVFLDFGFNGWGMKFAATKDNAINGKLYANGILPNLIDTNHFILEGGSIETDGEGTLLSTAHCLLAPNRNQPMSLQEIESFLTTTLGISHFLWLDHGYLAGDDTDSHIDTLARFCNSNTICYVATDDENDEHFTALQLMENQLKSFKDQSGKPYNLIPLPMAEIAYDDDKNRLPATYANFLITNEKVLVPTYRSPTDKKALEIITNIFKDRQVVGIDCTALIKQHGSLHCITIQIPDFTK